jgi:hypothetical protein
MPLPPEKLSAQPAAQVGSEADMGMVVQDGQTRRQTRTQLRTAILSAWQTFIRTFLASATTADARAALAAAKSGANTDITSLSLTTPLSVAQGGTGANTAPLARAALGVLNVGPDYINGLTAVWNSANSISITGGSAYIPSSGTVLTLAGTITKSSLVLSAATFYHVYLYSNAGTPDIEIVTTAPSAKYSGSSRTKTGDTSRRYLFSFLTAAADTIIRFKHANNKVSYLADYLAAPLVILTNGLATTSTAVSASGAVPVTATHTCMAIFNSSAVSGASVFLNDADIGAVTNANAQISVPFGLQATLDFSISASQTLNYIYPATAPSGNGTYLRVFGYLFER